MKELILGGARSGKSGYAERRALTCGKSPVYVATGWADDEEMVDRIARHRAERGEGWLLVEEPLHLSRGHGTPAIVGMVASTGGPRALECVLEAIGADFPLPIVLVQHITPSFQKGFVSWLARVAPQPRMTASRQVSADEPKVSGFVFKIQANMDPKHRDRVAFVRLLGNLLNPKVVLFFVTFLPQFVDAHDPAAPQKLFFLGFEFIALSVPLMVVFVYFAERIADAFRRTKWVERAINWSFAGIFPIFAATILTAQARH